jgi:hypothetical protein
MKSWMLLQMKSNLTSREYFLLFTAFINIVLMYISLQLRNPLGFTLNIACFMICMLPFYREGQDGDE